METRLATPRKVLVVDDSLTVRRSAQRALSAGGHEVRLAADGFEALALVHDFAPDVVLCDILMPRLDGYQTCAIIKRHPRFAHLPVVMLSSRDGVFDVARGRLAGACDHLAKPFTPETLLDAVARHAAPRAPAEAL
jgi:twitching motility two-component system response regulator PilG